MHDLDRTRPSRPGHVDQKAIRANRLSEHPLNKLNDVKERLSTDLAIYQAEAEDKGSSIFRVPQSEMAGNLGGKKLPQGLALLTPTPNQRRWCQVG